MEFKVIAYGVPDLFGKKDKSENFSAKSAEEARGIVTKKFPKAKEILLYQLLGKGEKPEYYGQEYSRSWARGDGWDNNTTSCRIIPSKALPVPQAKDEATDEELTRKYLASLS